MVATARSLSRALCTTSSPTAKTLCSNATQAWCILLDRTCVSVTGAVCVWVRPAPAPACPRGVSSCTTCHTTHGSEKTFPPGIHMSWGKSCWSWSSNIIRAGDSPIYCNWFLYEKSTIHKQTKHINEYHDTTQHVSIGYIEKNVKKKSKIQKIIF